MVAKRTAAQRAASKRNLVKARAARTGLRKGVKLGKATYSVATKAELDARDKGSDFYKWRAAIQKEIKKSGGKPNKKNYIQSALEVSRKARKATRHVGAEPDMPESIIGNSVLMAKWRKDGFI